MHKYEIMFIVKATMESADVKKTAETFKKLVSDLKGTVAEYKELGIAYMLRIFIVIKWILFCYASWSW